VFIIFKGKKGYNSKEEVSAGTPSQNTAKEKRAIKNPSFLSTHALVYTIGTDKLPENIHVHMLDVISQTGKQPLFILFGKETSLETITYVIMRGLITKTVCAWYAVPNGNKLVYIMKVD
jgi:hypothetical protein